MKTCPKCRTEKPLSEFRMVRNNQGKWVHHSWCTPCKNAAMREYRKSAKAEDGRLVRRVAKIGEKASRAKLTDDDVRLVRQLEPKRYYQIADEVAEKFEVKRSTILKIWRGDSWTHV
jgi:thiol-disulfide isomerase/thioredoxin